MGISKQWNIFLSNKHNAGILFNIFQRNCFPLKRFYRKIIVMHLSQNNGLLLTCFQSYLSFLLTKTNFLVLGAKKKLLKNNQCDIVESRLH